MTRRNQHVVPLGNGWAVKPAGVARVTVITTKQSEAISYARNIAQKSHSDLIIHRRNGKIRERSSYGYAPLVRKG